MLEHQSIKIANKYFQQAFDSQMQGDVKLAQENYLLSIEIHPTAEAYVNLGWTFSNDGNFEGAIKQCNKALVLDIKHSMAYSDIGYYMLQLGRIDEAIVWLNEAITSGDFPGIFYTYYNLGKAYEQNGVWKKALEMYGKSILRKPGFKLGKEKLLSLSARLN